MIGQSKLLARLNEYNINNFPRSTIFLGSKGSGKHMLVNYIKDNIVKLPLIDITANISNEYLDEIYRNPNPSIYLIDLSEITEKAQNTILKFVEEPSNNAFIILLAEHKNLVLNTVLNRCMAFELDLYSRDELMSFVEDIDDSKICDIILEVLKTPGRIKSTNLKTFSEAQDLCNKIIDKIEIASYANTLSIAGKVNYKDEYDKIDVDLLLDLLCFSLISRYKEINNVKLLRMYSIVREHRKSLVDKRVNKQLLFEHCLSELWKASRGS